MWKAQRNLGCWYRCYFDTSRPPKHCSSNCKTLPTRSGLSDHITQERAQASKILRSQSNQASAVCTRTSPIKSPAPNGTPLPAPQCQTHRKPPKVHAPMFQSSFGSTWGDFFSIKAPVLRGDKKYPVFEYCVRDMFGFSSFHCLYMLGSWIWSIVSWHILGTAASILGGFWERSKCPISWDWQSGSYQLQSDDSWWFGDSHLSLNCFADPYRFCMLTFRDYMPINPACLHALWEYGARVDLK